MKVSAASPVCWPKYVLDAYRYECIRDIWMLIYVMCVWIHVCNIGDFRSILTYMFVCVYVCMLLYMCVCV